jgi:RNA polymerase sigma factor (sigma-70 family)
MTTVEAMPATERSDADLVTESLTGSREAFRLIVERYQTLICSLAYSGTGNVTQSEDVAQETFISAWKDLRSLREPDKLRPWLCSIVRNRIQRNRREEKRALACNALPLEGADDSPSPEALPSEQAISQEEEAIRWRSLEKIPELYREPLVLFYRQHRSIESVAKELDLSEDAVRQRLSRGRKLLQEKVEAFLENTLRRTAPGQAFSTAVFATLPLAAGSAATAGAGAGVKGTAVVKSGLLAAWVGPLVGIVAGFASHWLVIRAHTPEHKRRPKLLQLVGAWIAVLGIPVLGENTVRLLGQHSGWSDRTRFIAVAGFWEIYAIVLATWLVVIFRRESAVQRRGAESGETPGAILAPLTSVETTMVVAGTYLTMFSWLIYLTWRVHDWTVAASITGFIPVLSVLSFFRHRQKTGVTAVRVSYGFLAWCGVLVVALINFRLAGWVAAARGVSVAEVHRLLPFGIIPLLTGVLLVWCGVVLSLTKSRQGP